MNTGKKLLILFLIVFLISVSAVVYFYFSNREREDLIPVNSSPITTPSAPQVDSFKELQSKHPLDRSLNEGFVLFSNANQAGFLAKVVDLTNDKIVVMANGKESTFPLDENVLLTKENINSNGTRDFPTQNVASSYTPGKKVYLTIENVGGIIFVSQILELAAN